MKVIEEENIDNFNGKINSVNFENGECITYLPNVFVVTLASGRNFLVMKKRLSNHLNTNIYKEHHWQSNFQTDSIFYKRLRYGSDDSFIVDMQGIKNFINASNLDFNDEDIRAILIKTGILTNQNYLRVGVAGAPETPQSSWRRGS